MSANNTTNTSQSQSFGRPQKDLGLSIISTDHLTSKLITSVEHIDTNVVEIEKDIFDLQEVAFRSAEESLNTMQEISTVQNDLVELHYIQSLPWFCKSNFVYGVVTRDQWNISMVPDGANPIFVRYVDLQDTFTGMILCIQRVDGIGEARHVSIQPKSNEASVYIATKPELAVRLSSYDIEWFPSLTPESESDSLVGHGSLLAKPVKLGGFVFGSSAESNSEGQCIVFPNSGPFYVQSIYIDNNSGHSRIILVGQKYQASFGKQLSGFSFYGIQ